MMNAKGKNDLAEQVETWLCAEKLYFTYIEGCCPTSISLSDAVFNYNWFADQDKMYHGVDFWHLFGKGQKVLEHKVRELRGEGEQDDVPPDMKASLETLDFLIDAWESLSEENMKLLTDQLWDCREIDSNVIIARELIAPLLGPQDVIVLNSHHAASSELYALAKGLSKLRVASTMSIWRGLGIGHPSTWHGEADMMVVPRNATAAVAASGVTAVLAQPVTDDPDEDILDAGCTTVEGKLCPSDFGLGLSQAIATAITFSFVYKTHYCYEGTLFPTVQVSSRGFEIFLYDSDTDVLLMNTYSWTRKTIVFLWAVLHYRLLLSKTTLSSENFNCGYREISDKYGGFTRLEGLPKFAVPLASISKPRRNVCNVLLRYSDKK